MRKNLNESYSSAGTEKSMEDNQLYAGHDVDKTDPESAPSTFCFFANIQ